MPLKGGARKAKKAMRRKYGKSRGDRVFWATANKRGKGKSRDAKARSAFKSKRIFKRKRKKGRKG